MKTDTRKKIRERASGPTLGETTLGRHVRQQIADEISHRGRRPQSPVAKSPAPGEATYNAISAPRHPLEHEVACQQHGCPPEAQDATVPGPAPRKLPSRDSRPVVALSGPASPSPSTVNDPKERVSSPPGIESHRTLNREMRRRLGFDLSQPALLRLADVLELYRVSRSTWYAGIKSGLYEPGIPIGPRCVAWRSEYILSLLANPPKFVRG